MTAPSFELFADADLPDDLRPVIADLRARAFGHLPQNPYTWSKPQWHVLVWLDAALVGYLGLFSRACTAGNQPVQLAGIGSVMTDPDHRHQGHATAALQLAVAFMRDTLRADFCLLVNTPDLIPFYQRQGWQPVPGPMVFQQPDGDTYTWGEAVMIMPLHRQDWPPGPIDLHGLPW